jgi:hypothetical protein
MLDGFIVVGIVIIVVISVAGVVAALVIPDPPNSRRPRPEANNKPDHPRPVSPEPWERPASQHVQRISSPKSYPALRVISFLLRMFGWIAIGVGVCCFLVVFGLVGSNLNAVITKGISSGFSPFLISIMTPTGIFFVMVGLWNLAIGEGLKVFVDIALNTEPLKKIAQDWPSLRHPFNTTDRN